MTRTAERIILSITLMPIVGGIIGWVTSLFMKGVSTKECIIFFAIAITVIGLFTAPFDDADDDINLLNK